MRKRGASEALVSYRPRLCTKNRPLQMRALDPPGGPSRAHFRPIGVHLGPSWVHCDAIWVHVGPIVVHVGPIWLQLRPIWVDLRSNLGPCGSHVSPKIERVRREGTPEVRPKNDSFPEM